MRTGSVHPRAGGEHGKNPGWPHIVCGSSPRERGTLVRGDEDCSDSRFIPARAGNTMIKPDVRIAIPVHPRAGGEHRRPNDYQVPFTGSSPRGRGTPAPERLSGSVHRFIPARAGNTRSSSPRRRWRSVHPRAGGEHTEHLGRLLRFAGSSPRGRGTPLLRHVDVSSRRFIPARAGNTTPCRLRSRRTSVHPRAGGEHVEVLPFDSGNDGSSPRGRGTPILRVRQVEFHRFIPARAGNTLGVADGHPSAAVHPRAGGEHIVRLQAVMALSGSSPRGRGTHEARRPWRRRRRFIPARAGNTRHAVRSRSLEPVHPRAGGEHRLMQAT